MLARVKISLCLAAPLACASGEGGGGGPDVRPGAANIAACRTTDRTTDRTTAGCTDVATCCAADGRLNGEERDAASTADRRPPLTNVRTPVG